MPIGVGNSSHINRITIIQKRTIRIINNTKYRTHTDPLFKSYNILKVSDAYTLQISQFMYDFHNKLLPSSFKTLHINKVNANNIVTRQTKNMPTDRPRTQFSANLPKHNFPFIWNKLNLENRAAKSRHIFKKNMKKSYLQRYKDHVVCNDPYCTDCNENQPWSHHSVQQN